jgi:Mrp family chromosome partitioning ATPase
MKEFVEKVKGKFDTVIFDSPPLTLVTDAAILSSIIESTVLVISSKKTVRPAINRAKHILNNAKANVLGIVLNSLHMDSGGSYYYSQYYYRKDDKRKIKKKT